MSIKQSAQGFRVLQLINNPGIGEDKENVRQEDDATKEVFTFIDTLGKKLEKFRDTTTVNFMEQILD